MSDNQETQRIFIQAQKLLRDGRIGNALVKAYGQVGTPIMVQSPDGGFHSWFVPVSVGDQLAGFFQFLPDDTFMRYSSFQRQPGELAGCPSIADWLDLERIQARAEVLRKPDEKSGKPFLTYDRSPDRLVWAVPLTHDRGEVRFVYVVGSTAYAPYSGDIYG